MDRKRIDAEGMTADKVGRAGRAVNRNRRGRLIAQVKEDTDSQIKALLEHILRQGRER